MPASLVTFNPSTAVFGRLQDQMRWDGNLVLNAVQGGNAPELALIDQINLGGLVRTGALSSGTLNLVFDVLGRLDDAVGFTWSVDDAALDANYLLHGFERPGSAGSAGFAERPSQVAGNPAVQGILGFRLDNPSVMTDIQNLAIITHEIGHALGLYHTVPGAVSGGSLGDLFPPLDNFKYSVMSYVADTGYAITLMPLDLAALQHMYGAVDANTGDTRYTLTASGIDLAGADGSVTNGGGYAGVWDTGGAADAIAYSGSAKVLINLNAATLTATLTGDLLDIIDALKDTDVWSKLDADTRAEIDDPSLHQAGFFSSILSGSGRANGGYSIANGVVIERAIGSSNEDILIGNAASNVLSGNGDNDTLIDGAGTDLALGGAGDDRFQLVGDTASDLVVGGGGDDVVRTSDPAAQVGEVVFGGETADFRGTPTVASEFQAAVLALGAAAATAQSNRPGDYAESADGDDDISLGAGADLVSGGLGADTINGGAGGDFLFGDDGNDVIIGGDGNDALAGGDGQNILEGGAGADLFLITSETGVARGGDGADKFVLTTGGSEIDGGAGNDLYDISRLEGDGQLVIRVGWGDGHDTILAPGDAGRIKIVSDDFDMSQFSLGFGPLDLVPVGKAGSADPLDEDPIRETYRGAIIIKIGDVRINFGYYEWTRFHEWDGSGAIREERLTGLSVELELDLSGDTDFGEWRYLHSDDFAPGWGWEGPSDPGRSDYYIERGEATLSDDQIAGTPLDDRLNGLAGDDQLDGGDGNDRIDGGDGVDEIAIGSGNNTVDGGAGYDTVIFGESSTLVSFVRNSDGTVQAVTTGTAASNLIMGVEAIYFEGDATWRSLEQLVGEYGTGADDPYINGSSNADHLFGLSGDDVIFGAGGNDIIDGGSGFDTASYEGLVADFSFVRNADGSVSVIDALGGEGSDRLVDVEAVYFETEQAWFSIFGLVGDYGTEDSDEWLSGTAGNDNLYGLGGDDMFVGEQGNDMIDGGDGEDTVVYRGSFQDFTFVARPGGAVQVTDAYGSEGVDTLYNVEGIYFEANQTWVPVADLFS